MYKKIIRESGELLSINDVVGDYGGKYQWQMRSFFSLLFIQNIIYTMSSEHCHKRHFKHIRAGTELRVKNLVASRASSKSYWPPPKFTGPQLCTEMLWWISYV